MACLALVVDGAGIYFVDGLSAGCDDIRAAGDVWGRDGGGDASDDEEGEKLHYAGIAVLLNRLLYWLLCRWMNDEVRVENDDGHRDIWKTLYRGIRPRHSQVWAMELADTPQQYSLVVLQRRPLSRERMR